MGTHYYLGWVPIILSGGIMGTHYFPGVRIIFLGNLMGTHYDFGGVAVIL